MKNAKIAEHIIALERAAIEELCRGNIVPCLESCAPELTYFDPFTPRRWDLEQTREVFEQIVQLNIEQIEMIEPLVQLHGDVAVLTYNFTASNSKRVWSCTEVYRRFPDESGNGGGDSGNGRDDGDDIGVWKIIHCHLSDVHSKQ